MILAMAADSMSALRVGVQAQPMSMKRISRYYDIDMGSVLSSRDATGLEEILDQDGQGARSHKHSRPKKSVQTNCSCREPDYHIIVDHCDRMNRDIFASFRIHSFCALRRRGSCRALCRSLSRANSAAFRSNQLFEI